MAVVLGRYIRSDKYLSGYQPEIFSLGNKQHSNAKRKEEMKIIKPLKFLR